MPADAGRVPLQRVLTSLQGLLAQADSAQTLALRQVAQRVVEKLDVLG